MMSKDWDLTIVRIEPHIDGKKFVKRISGDAEVSIGEPPLFFFSYW